MEGTLSQETMLRDQKLRPDWCHTGHIKEIVFFRGFGMFYDREQERQNHNGRRAAWGNMIGYLLLARCI